MKFRATFEVDNHVLFDTLHRMNGDTSELGRRMAEQLLTSTETSFIDALGMSAYGVQVIKKEIVDGG